MKLAYLVTAFMMVLSFKVRADELSAKSADELPIVQFETKKELQADLDTSKKKKKLQQNQLVVSDSSDMQLGLVVAKKSKNKTSEKVEEEDFSRLDRELEVLK